MGKRKPKLKTVKFNSGAPGYYTGEGLVINGRLVKVTLDDTGQSLLAYDNNRAIAAQKAEGKL